MLVGWSDGCECCADGANSAIQPPPSRPDAYAAVAALWLVALDVCTHLAPGVGGVSRKHAVVAVLAPATAWVVALRRPGTRYTTDDGRWGGGDTRVSWYRGGGCHFCVRVTASRIGGRARRGEGRGLSAQLVTYRAAAGISQPQLGQAVGRTRTTISKVEHGTRTLPAALWKVADDLRGAEGVLVAEHEALAR